MHASVVQEQIKAIESGPNLFGSELRRMVFDLRSTIDPSSVTDE